MSNRLAPTPSHHVAHCVVAARTNLGGCLGDCMAKRLTAIGIKNQPDGKLRDGGGLMLVKSGDGGKWVYRYSHLGRRREMGLGSWPTVTLAEARRTRDGWASVLSKGTDPLEKRKADRMGEISARDRSDPTLSQAVQSVFDSRRAGLRGDGKRGRWLSPLITHVLPKIGGRRISEIHQTEIRDVLAPIWHDMQPTAQKAIQRLRIVFRESQLMGYDCDPFTIAAAERMLGEVNHQVQHIPATPWQDVPGLYERLNPVYSSGLCLRWMLLTLVRLEGCRGASLDEIDGNVWIVPAERMKGRQGKAEPFRVPLSAAAMQIVDAARGMPGHLLFPGARGVVPITSRALEKYLTDMGEVGRPHGFRSSFRTWVQDCDTTTYDVSETILAHAVGNKVERTYARSDMLERRRPVMDAWAGYVTGQSSARVVSITG